MQLTGLTVEQVIEKLQKQNPKALVIVPAGDGTVAGVEAVRRASAYRYTKSATFGGSPFLCSFDGAPDGVENAVESVLIE
jgi:hypothetical protein